VFDLESLKILEVNAAAEREYGYSRDEFLKMKAAWPVFKKEELIRKKTLFLSKENISDLLEKNFPS
jgi:PAS domain-containing protein